MTETICATPRLDLAAVGDLHTNLMTCKGQDVTVDMANVTHLGALCLQVLIAAGQSARTGGHRMKIINTSDRVLWQLNLMGMTPELIVEGPDEP